MIMQRPTSGPVPCNRIREFTGIDKAFNAAVLHIAGKLNPCGWDIVPERYAPSTLGELRMVHAITGRIAISGANSDRTIFGDPEVNFAFRAWHDWHHLKLGAQFDPAGELAVANSQAGDLIALYGAAVSRPWRKLLEIEINGQVRYFAYHNCFPDDQIGFARAQLAGKPMSTVFH